MSDEPEWKKALREPNTFVWIAFLLLVIGVGVGTLMFEGGPVAVKDRAQATSGSSAAHLK
jgi:hypothetical protein